MIKAIIFDFFGVLEQTGKPNKPLLDFIRSELKPKYKLGIISNAEQDWVSEILDKTDAAMFDNVVLSHREGVAKPESAMYQISLDNLGVRVDESVFIDDIERYCDAARAVGMQAILYRDFDQMKTNLEAILKS